MQYTISTQNGSNFSREHNIRNPKVTEHEIHIDPNGKFEVWHDEKIRSAYTRLFEVSLKEYNLKQKRKCRQIENYYTKISNDKQKHLAYEIIIAIGNSKDCIVEPEVGKEIMHEYVEAWEGRNPKLEMIGAYYHADEKGVPHVHIDYIPVADEYKTGMKIQNGLQRAFAQMGFEKEGKETGQIKWERSENKYLEELCTERGLEIIHPKEEGRKHLDNESFKAKKDLENTLEELERTIETRKQVEAEILDGKSEKVRLSSEIEKLEGKYQNEADFQNRLHEKKSLFINKKKIILEREDYMEIDYKATKYEENKDVINLAPELRLKEIELNEKIKQLQVLIAENAKESSLIDQKVREKVRKKVKELIDPIQNFFKEKNLDNGKNAWNDYEKHQKTRDDEDERFR